MEKILIECDRCGAKFKQAVFYDLCRGHQLSIDRYSILHVKDYHLCHHCYVSLKRFLKLKDTEEDYV